MTDCVGADCTIADCAGTACTIRMGAEATCTGAAEFGARLADVAPVCTGTRVAAISVRADLALRSRFFFDDAAATTCGCGSGAGWSTRAADGGALELVGRSEGSVAGVGAGVGAGALVVVTVVVVVSLGRGPSTVCVVVPCALVELVDRVVEEL